MAEAVSETVYLDLFQGRAQTLIPDFSPKNSVESDYLLQTNSYRNFR